MFNIKRQELELDALIEVTFYSFFESLIPFNHCREFVVGNAKVNIAYLLLTVQKFMAVEKTTHPSQVLSLSLVSPGPPSQPPPPPQF